MQGLIESSKFESGDLDLDEIQKRTGDAPDRLRFVALARASVARYRASNVVRTAEVELDSVIATALEALATRVAGGSEPPVPELEDTLECF